MKVQLVTSLLLFGLIPAVSAQNTGHQNPKPQVNKVLREARLQVSDKKNFKVSYTPEPDPLPLNQHFRIKLLVQTPQNQLVSDAQITIAADMPEHNHGMNVKPQIKALGKGLYEVRGLLFHMPGYWEITVNIVQQKYKEKAVFGITLNMPKVSPDRSHH